MPLTALPVVLVATYDITSREENALCVTNFSDAFSDGLKFAGYKVLPILHSKLIFSNG